MLLCKSEGSLPHCRCHYVSHNLLRLAVVDTIEMDNLPTSLCNLCNNKSHSVHFKALYFGGKC